MKDTQNWNREPHNEAVEEHLIVDGPCSFVLCLARHLISDTKQSDQSQNPFQSETLSSGRERNGWLLELSHPAKERQCEAPVAGNDGDRRHYEWLPFSSHARARRPEKSLAQSESEAKQICGRRRRRHRHARDRAGGKGNGTRDANRSAEGSRDRHPESARVMVGHHAQCAQRLDPLDHLPQAARDARAPDQKCLLDARGREATRLLLRPVRVLQ